MSSSFQQALEAAQDFRKKLGEKPENAMARQMVDDIIKKIEQSAPDRQPVDNTGMLVVEIEKARLDNYRMDMKVLAASADKFEAEAAEHAFNVEQAKEFLPFNKDLKGKEIMAKIAERGLALQMIRTSKQEERLFKLQGDLVQTQIDGVRAENAIRLLEEKTKELAEVEDKLPRAQALLKLLEDKINGASRELKNKNSSKMETKPLKKREEPLTATIGEAVAQKQEEAEAGK